MPKIEAAIKEAIDRGARRRIRQVATPPGGAGRSGGSDSSSPDTWLDKAVWGTPVLAR